MRKVSTTDEKRKKRAGAKKGKGPYLYWSGSLLCAKSIISRRKVAWRSMERGADYLGHLVRFELSGIFDVLVRKSEPRRLQGLQSKLSA